MRLTVLGCGDAFGSGGRFNTCFHLALDDGRRIALDFGATSMVALHREGIDPDSLDAVVISHLHGDHFGGLPFLILYLQFAAERHRPLTIAGPPGVGERVTEATRVLFGGAQGPWRFPLNFVEISPGRAYDVAGLGVEAFPVVHGNITSHALRLDDGQRVLAFSGDTAWTDVLLEVGRDADLFIMECYAADGPCATHTDWPTLRAHLPEITAKRVLLTHLNPDMLAHRDDLTVGALHDGMVIDV
jgi:ribonuclease BN (tRNA processing enzyme)